MRLPDNLLACHVSLYGSTQDAEAGIKAGGVGFFAGVGGGAEDGYWVFVVTNRHVVEDGQCRVIRLGSTATSAQVVETRLDEWNRSDRDDLAVLLLNPDDHRFDGRFVTPDEFVSQEVIETHRIGTGDQVFMVSAVTLPENRSLVSPVALFGYISTMVEIGIIRGDCHEQVSLLAEMRSVGGCSGAPVFVFIPPSEVGYRRTKVHQCGPWLLGVNWGHLTHTVKVEMKHETSSSVPQNSAIAGIVPAWRLLEFLKDTVAQVT